MVLIRRSLATLLVGLFSCLVARGATSQETPSVGQVTLPLRDYVELVERGDAIEKARAEQLAHQEPVVTEIATQHLSVTIESDQAVLRSALEIVVRGVPQRPIPLALAGVVEDIAVTPAGHAAVGLDASQTVVLVTPESGRFIVHTTSRQALASHGGVLRVPLGPALAPVAVFDLELPADLAWSCPRAVFVTESVHGGRRSLRLSAARGADVVLDLHQAVADDQSRELEVKTAELMLFQLDQTEMRRYDVVLYTVARGGLVDFDVELPSALQPRRVVTDEGAVQPVIDHGHLIVHRKHRLQGHGYLVLVSTLPIDPSTPLAPLVVHPSAQASYFAIASAIPAEAVPQPPSAWSRIDVDDLPIELRQPLAALGLTAAWRLTNPSVALALQVTALPAAPAVKALVSRRETTTLVTVDGTVLHRDRFTLARSAAALEIELPQGATLWSATVGDQAVRPLLRGGTVIVPLLGSAPVSSTGSSSPVVEIVTVLARVVPTRNADLRLELPQVSIPVLEQNWQLLLPESSRYRFRSSELRPVPSRPAAASPGGISSSYYDWDRFGPEGTATSTIDRVNVGGNESKQSSASVGAGAAAQSVWGAVVDSQGAPQRGAAVSLLSTSGGGRHHQTTDDKGRFRLDGLTAGTYTLRAELAGFPTATLANLVVPSPSTNHPLAVVLSSAVEDAITVTTESPLLDERKISSGATAEIHELQKIPTARDPWKSLREGLVGGVKPIAVVIPEVGKSLLLTGVLPAARITVWLEEKPMR